MFFKVKEEPADGNLQFSTESAQIVPYYDGDNKTISEDLKVDIGMDVNRNEIKPANLISANNINETISLKSEIKEEPVEYSLLMPLEHIDDTTNTSVNNEISYENSKIENGDGKFIKDINLNWTGQEVGSANPENKINGEIEFEIKDELVDENELILIEIVDDTKNASNNTDIGHTSDSFVEFRTSDVTEYFNKHEKRKRNISINFETQQKTKKLMSHQCDSCGMDFDKLGNFKKHTCPQSEEKPYKCEHCNKRFAQSNYLNTHKCVHPDKKLYRCEVCNGCFTQSRSLKVHKIIHTGEKPYQCDACNSCFSHSNYLYYHKRIHTGEKPYKCDVCNKSFVSSSNLNCHKRTHTGDKPYICVVCKKSFAHSSNFIRHMRIHTLEKPL